jgi:hypothetical protein
MKGWSELAAECAAWGAAGRTATWWWRDDDAVDDTPALRQLLDTAQGPIALAVIPAGLQAGLSELLNRRPAVRVLQHGFAHRNHAAAGARKTEFPDERDAGAIALDLRAGMETLAAAFHDQFLTVLTPPWNRIGDAALGGLRRLGFTGLSRYNARATRLMEGVILVNTHVDVIDWRGSRGFLGEEPCLALFGDHLRRRRLGQVEPEEPTGLLTHHLVHDPATWRFLEKLRDFLSQQPATRLLDPAAAFR